MESVNAPIEAQEEPVRQHADNIGPMTSFNFHMDEERRCIGAPSALTESSFAGASCSKKHISITAAAAHARTATFIILAITAAIYLLVDPVSS